ncbi:UDP-4-amino-4,6-dideoxy-N-acetyl-beta-L-altrosamine transaminase [Bermanella sp. R86510]|uniref:UDP-4-amino-4, 6-dideoxy-N-acetyl-beta-L-altrosamine transaminase n=1 Tax=unclassified Bermanella TaxID=2627862 RepID=UPI0037C7B48D
MIPYGKQDISQKDVDAVVEVLKSDFLTQGPYVPEFEKQLAQYSGAQHAVAVNSATSALHIACMALGVGPGDAVWTSPISFVASANCARYCGAAVDFVDIDLATYNLCPRQLEAKLKHAKQHGLALPKVVIPVHLSGLPCEMSRIHELGQEYGFSIIEDASHAVGGSYQNHKIGACEYSDITVFSFHPVKIITTAEGGLATTNNNELAQKMALFRSHGVTRDVSLMEGESHGDWYYQQVDLGYNYRMTELQAALGCSQLTRLDEFVARRHELAKRYLALLAHLPLVLPEFPSNSYSGLHLFIVRVDATRTHVNRKQLFDVLRDNGIGVNVHYIPIHTQPYYRKLGFSLGDFPNSEAYYDTAISLPMFHLLTDEQQDQVVSVLTQALGASS